MRIMTTKVSSTLIWKGILKGIHLQIRSDTFLFCDVRVSFQMLSQNPALACPSSHHIICFLSLSLALPHQNHVPAVPSPVLARAAPRQGGPPSGERGGFLHRPVPLPREALAGARALGLPQDRARFSFSKSSVFLRPFGHDVGGSQRCGEVRVKVPGI